MNLTDRDLTLLALNELALHGLLEPSGNKRVDVVKLQERVPSRVRDLVRVQLNHILEVYFAARAGSDVADETDFLTEVADIIFQCAPDEVRAEVSTAADSLQCTAPVLYVSLAIFAKYVAAKETVPPLIRQRAEEITWLKPRIRATASAA